MTIGMRSKNVLAVRLCDLEIVPHISIQLKKLLAHKVDTKIPTSRRSREYTPNHVMKSLLSLHFKDYCKSAEQDFDI